MKKNLKALIFTLSYIILPLALNLIVIKLVRDMDFFKALTATTPVAALIVVDSVSLPFLYFFVKYVRRVEKPFRFASFNKVGKLNLALSAIIGFLLSILTASLLNVDALRTGTAQIGYTINFFIGGNIALIIIASIVNNMFKEICFRGLAFNEMKAVIPVAIALFIQASIYGFESMYLGNPIYTILYAFTGQLVFGIVFVAGRSIWSSFVCQVVCSTGLVLLLRTGARSFFNNTNSIISLVVVIIASVVLTLLLKNKSQEASVKNTMEAGIKASLEVN